MREKDIVPIEQAVVLSLERFPDLLVEKARRVPAHDPMLEISARWLGLDAHPNHVVNLIRREWDDSVLAAESARFHVLLDDDAVVLAFVGTYADERCLTGRVKVVF